MFFLPVNTRDDICSITDFASIKGTPMACFSPFLWVTQITSLSDWFSTSRAKIFNRKQETTSHSFRIQDDRHSRSTFNGIITAHKTTNTTSCELSFLIPSQNSPSTRMQLFALFRILVRHSKQEQSLGSDHEIPDDI